MNFRELINKLDQINEAEGLTLQSIAAVEKAAMDKAVAEKAKGGFTGFTTWDPRTAGNIALAKLAQQNNFEGLFNSEGDFVVAYGNRTWSSNSELHPGESPRVVPPSPDDWKPLAAKGLVPQNAKGPAGLINWLSSGGAQKEFDAVKKQSADVAAGTGAVDAAQTPKVTSADEEAKMTQLEGLVDQYLKLKEDIRTGVKKNQAAKVTTRDPMDDSDDAGAHAFDPTWGGTKATGGQTVAPNAGATWDNSKQMAVPGVVKESALAATLVESFGYQKKTSIAELIESFGYRKNHPYSLLEQDADLSLSSKYDKPKDAKSKKDDDDFDPDAYLQSKYGDADDTTSGRVDNRTWQEKNVFTSGAGAKAIDALGRTISGKNKKPVSKDPQGVWDTMVHNKYWNNWTEDSLSWEDEIIPGVYSFKDLGIDLGIAAGFVLVGTIMAPFTAGASVPVAYAGAGAILVRLLIRIGWAIVKAVMLYGKPFWELVKLKPWQATKAVGQIVKTHAEGFYKGLVGNFAKAALMISALASAGFNGAALILKELWPEAYKAIGKGVDSALDTIQPGIDWARKKTGLEEGLQ
jgi:hypothetical protein